MITLKQLKPALNFIKKQRRPILTQVLVDKNGMNLTDLESFLTIKDSFDLSYGLHDINTLGLIDNPKNNIDDYPIIDKKHYITNKFAFHLDQIETFLKFTSKDETRLNLNSIAITKKGVVSTDGHKMLFIENNIEIENDFILPASALKTLVKLLKKFKIKDAFLIEFNADYAYIDNEYFSMNIRLNKREFPKWSNLIPRKFKGEFVIDGWIDFKELKPLFNQRNFSGKLFNSDNVLMFQITGTSEVFEIGKCDENFKIEIGVNSSYLNTILGKSKSVNFKFNNELSPIYFKNEYEGVVMPIKL